MPYRVHTILTDNGIRFTEHPGNRGVTLRKIRFGLICKVNGIENRLTGPNHPWTSNQLEHMNRTTKDATVTRYRYDGRDQPHRHLAGLLAA
ncbi:hypothetical protein [Sinisalibacter aestuarii]|uniref:Integrase catalytic domain-containing protein n=1 Tax=Sinisalibacter aestuarii TaxID=2949426 RepID=A0ABQ5LTH4_9RHOB|nr:hypothetical protein [Sinisalibacter aestuarii]GKY88290.1 hypothetical protein STA1M1_21590 [Sinisalibacter aestuarii]